MATPLNRDAASQNGRAALYRDTVSTCASRKAQPVALRPVPRDAAGGAEQGDRGPDPCRVVVLWPHVPSYLAACLEALLSAYDTDVLLVVTKPDAQENHTTLERFARFKYVSLAATDGPSEAAASGMICAFKPTIVLAGCGKWGTLTRLARAARDAGAPVIWAVDNYWRGTWRDYANATLANLGLIYNFFDAAWVPGACGRRYVRRLGFDDCRIFEGIYACDTALFRRVGLGRFEAAERGVWPRVFLFIGQYIERKNLDTLLAAYARYRDMVADPWDLWCAGRGPLQTKLHNCPGVRDQGYQSPAGCADLMARAGAFVLPSWIDHWGVVIHEATCAGLPVLASRTCAAANSLVRDGYNGFQFSPNGVRRLADLMRRVATGERAETMGRNSLRMSYQFDPSLWARTLAEHIPYCLEGRTLARPAVSSPV